MALRGLAKLSLLRAVWSWSCNDTGASELLELSSLAEQDTLAVCNDASTAGYYYKPGGSRLWLLYLGGGGWCTDEVSCSARFDGSEYPHHDCQNSSASAPCFMSSKDYEPICSKGGIFASSALADAHKVYLPYCSSDGHMGDASFAGWQFRGARIVRATIQALQQRGLGAGDTLLLAGGSAGGRGAMVHLDQVAGTLRGVEVLGFLDSNYYVDLPGFDGNPGFQRGHAEVLCNFNASSVVSEECGKVHSDALWKCLFGAYRVPFLRTPYLMLAAQFDGWQLSHLVHNYTGIEKAPIYTDSELLFVEHFAKVTLSNLSSLEPPSGSMVYSTACYNHHISESTDFFTVRTASGVSEADALDAFLASRPISTGLVDHCQGFQCGSGCTGLVV